jgi:hypothetical protein
LERNHEFVNITTLFSLLSFVFDGVEVFIELRQNALSNVGVSKGVVDHSAEPGSGVGHEAVDVVLEIRLSSHSVNFFSGASHVGKEFLKESSEFRLLRVESHVSLSFIHIEKHRNSNEVLSGGSESHFFKDFLSTFLVNFNLSLEDHVVDQADVSTQRAVVSLSEEEKASAKRILRLLRAHALVFGGLASLRAFKVFFLTKGLVLGEILNQLG